MLRSHDTMDNDADQAVSAARQRDASAFAFAFALDPTTAGATPQTWLNILAVITITENTWHAHEHLHLQMTALSLAEAQ